MKNFSMDNMNPTLAWILNVVILIAIIGWAMVTYSFNLPVPVFAAGMVIAMTPWIADAFLSN